MAVETGHLNLFTPQLTQDRNVVSPLNQTNMNALHGGPQMLFPGNPVALLGNNSPSYQPALVCEGKTSVNTDSGLTYNVAPPRKRSRDHATDHNQMYPAVNFVSPQKNSIGASPFPSSAGEDVMTQIQHHQMDIDEIISRHTKKMRVELYQRQKQQARLLMAAIGEKVMNKLKEKDDQIARVGKLNLALQERVRTLYVENQLWRDLAQTNEAAVNSLRTNLEQVLAAAHIGGGEERVSTAEDDAESCCSSNDHEQIDAAVVEPNGGTTSFRKKGGDGCYGNDRRCRKCGERESTVLLLPCRHLCLCGPCGSGAHQLRHCPVCHASMNATLHVNMSP